MLIKKDKRQEQSFRPSLHVEFDIFLQQQSQRFAPENCLKIDFHCHDHNSDVPDELGGVSSGCLKHG